MASTLTSQKGRQPQSYLEQKNKSEQRDIHTYITELRQAKLLFIMAKGAHTKHYKQKSQHDPLKTKAAVGLGMLHPGVRHVKMYFGAPEIKEYTHHMCRLQSQLSSPLESDDSEGQKQDASTGASGQTTFPPLCDF